MNQTQKEDNSETESKPKMKKKTSFPKSKIKILLLENIHSASLEAFGKEKFQVESLKVSLSEKELIEKIRDVHALGIRSKTKITSTVLAEAKRLLCIGCFCIGTDQVDLISAEKNGIPVFNSPFCNSRSVAELIICEVISLARGLGDKNIEMHKGIWNKSAVNCHEIRGMTLGIVGYGHIGSQLSVLAESMGMRVIFYDINSIMPLGNSKSCSSLEEVLKNADFLSLHVPKTEQTHEMIGEKEINLMKKGSYLLNASRGTVVVLSALVEALKSGYLAGAAVDVYPTEPEANTDNWFNELRNCKNVILTPHIGGSTEEAQLSISNEVSEKIIRLINTGSTIGAVNFPAIELAFGGPFTHRILSTHRNVPGVLKAINGILGEVNVHGQILGTTQYVGYLIVDVEQETSAETKKAISLLSASIRVRILY